MASAIILGSGPAAAGVALALSRLSSNLITVIDLGLELEPEHQHVLDALGARPAEEWRLEDVEAIATRPVPSGTTGVPEKRSYGSDYPFRDIGQLAGVDVVGDGNRSVISAAYGGFSTVWGAQVMAFPAADLDRWVVTSADLAPHYDAVLREMPYAAEHDDLAERFPIFGTPTALPEPSSRTRRVLRAYDRHRSRLQRLGITVGKARLALNTPRCTGLGLCMTGCPLRSVYAASQTFDRLRSAGRVTYRPGLLAFSVAETADRAVVRTRDLATGDLHQFEADRVYVACGAIGTTRLVLSSLGRFDREVTLGESQQFVLPMVSLGAIPERVEQGFTLNQFNMTVDTAKDDFAQLHFYTHDPAFADALPRLLRSRVATPVRGQLLRRLSVVLGYLPSWHSPQLRMVVRPPEGVGGVPPSEISGAGHSDGSAMLRRVIRKLLRAAPLLDLYPILPKLGIAAPGKSYHFGSSFPHSDARRDGMVSDRLGRVAPWRRIHLVDGSVLPSLPAATFTLTVMANAHRIATEAAREQP